VDFNEVLRQVVGKVGEARGARAAFGEPYEQAGTMIIPVAAVTAKGGGGGGVGEQPGGRPSVNGGLGLRVESRPVGYIRVTGGLASFEPITDSTLLWRRVALFGGLALLLLLWGLRRRA
jgi:uncharacterized spore protein YtfJ